MRIEEKVEKRLEHWEEAGLRQLRSRTSKIFKETYERVEWTVRGTYLYENQRISLSDFQLSVDNFAKEAFSADYYPKLKKNHIEMSLRSFVYQPFANKPDLKLPLLFHLNHPPKRIIKWFKVDQKLYDAVAKAFVKNSGTHSINKLTSDQIENINLAAFKLQNFFKANQYKIDDNLLTTNRDKAGMFMRHVLSQLKDNYAKFNTRSLTWNWIWDSLPGFFTHHGYFVATKRKTMAQLEEETNAKRTRKRPTLKRRRPGVG